MNYLNWKFSLFAISYGNRELFAVDIPRNIFVNPVELAALIALRCLFPLYDPFFKENIIKLVVIVMFFHQIFLL